MSLEKPLQPLSRTSVARAGSSRDARGRAAAAIPAGQTPVRIAALLAWARPAPGPLASLSRPLPAARSLSAAFRLRPTRANLDVDARRARIAAEGGPCLSCEVAAIGANLHVERPRQVWNAILAVVTTAPSVGLRIPAVRKPV
jgi:hypothetical protein